MSDFYEAIMGQPPITQASGTAASSGDNTLIAAPAAGYRTVLLFLQVQNESATATTVLFKHGSTTVGRALFQNQGDGLVRDFSRYPVLMPAATALVLNLSGANSHGYTVEYTTVKVG